MIHAYFYREMGQPIYRYETIANDLLIKKGRRNSSTSSGESDRQVFVYLLILLCEDLKRLIAAGVLMEIHHQHLMIPVEIESRERLRIKSIESLLDGSPLLLTFLMEPLRVVSNA